MTRRKDQPLTRRPNGAPSVRDTLGRKQCTACELWLPEARFSPNGKASDGLQVKCHRCSHLGKYGLSKASYDAMLAAQGGACAICATRTPCGTGSWCIDHDHSCCPGAGSCGGCVRGLLCTQCNSMLGYSRDDVGLLAGAIDYLNEAAVRGARGL